MSIAIVLIVVFLVGALVVNFFPKKKDRTILAIGETLIPDEEEAQAPIVDNPTPAIIEVEKMSATPKKINEKKKTSKKVEANKK